MFCKFCGNEVKDEAVICPNCGCMIQDIKIISSKKVKQKQAINKQGVSGYCIAGFVVSLVAAFCYFSSVWVMLACSITGFVLSFIGIYKATTEKLKLRGLGIAGLVIGGVSIFWTICLLSIILWH